MPFQITLFAITLHNIKRDYGLNYYMAFLIYQAPYLRKVCFLYKLITFNFRHAKTFFKTHTHAGSLVNTTLPACCIYHFTLQNLQSSYLAQWARTINRIANRLVSLNGLERVIASDFSAQNYQNAEDTALL